MVIYQLISIIKLLVISILIYEKEERKILSL